MRFFIDNNLGKALAEGMTGFGEDVAHLQDHFDAAADDSEWLAHIGSKGWYPITRDDRIRYKPHEKRALKENEVGAFFLGGKNRSRCDLIQQLVRNWPRMKKFAARTDRPFAVQVPPSGAKLKVLPLA